MIICTSLFLLLACRLVWVNRTYAQHLSKYKCFQNVRTGTIPAERGRIFDCDGRPLAGNRDVSTLFVNPSRVPDEQKHDLALALAEYLGCDFNDTSEALQASDCTRRFLIREMSREDLARFDALPDYGELAELMKEVGVMSREARVYPTGPLAGPVIGFTACRDDGQVGLWGLEARYDDVLSGRDGAYRDMRDQRGERIPGSREVITPPRQGTDLVLTLDADIQAFAEEALKRGIDRTGSCAGVVVITEPSTGDVKALVSLPALDPANIEEYLEDETALFSRSTCLSFEAGSVMKVFTIAGGLQESVVSPESALHVGAGPLHFRGGWVPDHEYSYGSDMSLEDIVVHSSNRGAAIVAAGLGRDRLSDWLKDFGFGSRTPLEMPGEPSGDLKAWLNPFPEIDLANMGFGQGIAVTPLQLAQAMGVFANDGILIPLRLIESRHDSAWVGEVSFPHQQGVRVLREDVAQTMERFMTGVIDRGTAMQARTDWPCAGKTGTAQKIDPGGGYSTTKYYATFAGYGPLPDPKWLILVILDEPGYPYFGGSACGPVFREIFTGLMLRERAEPNADEMNPSGPDSMTAETDANSETRAPYMPVAQRSG
jgi:cell division protein FtsI (penicillin-binding protein 3)